MDVAFLLRRVNDINPRLHPSKKKAIAYILQLNKKDIIDLADVFYEAQSIFEFENNDEMLRFIAMIMKLSCCEGKYVKELLKDQNPALSKVDGFDLLKECLADHDDDSLISKLGMRAVLVSLDNKLHDRGHGERFLKYLCAQSELAHEGFDAKFSLFNYLEDCGRIAPKEMDLIERTLDIDKELKYAKEHFGKFWDNFSQWGTNNIYVYMTCLLFLKGSWPAGIIIIPFIVKIIFPREIKIMILFIERLKSKLSTVIQKERKFKLKIL